MLAVHGIATVPVAFAITKRQMAAEGVPRTLAGHGGSGSNGPDAINMCMKLGSEQA